MTTADGRAMLFRALELGTDVIGRVRPDQLADDVRRLLGQLVTVLHGMAGRGPVDVADDAWLEAWCDAAEDVLTGRPSGATLADHLNRITVHTWDLAVATGQRPAWDPQIVALAYDGARLLPHAGAVAIPDDAPLISRLAAMNGRPVLVTAPCGY